MIRFPIIPPEKYFRLNSVISIKPSSFALISILKKITNEIIEIKNKALIYKYKFVFSIPIIDKAKRKELANNVKKREPS